MRRRAELRRSELCAVDLLCRQGFSSIYDYLSLSVTRLILPVSALFDSFSSFCEKTGAYRVNYHHCTLCQHCMKVCPVGAITADTHNYTDFQEGMALCTKTVLDTFEPENRFFINLLISITALCDCWGMTTPSLVPDIGIVAGYDIVAVEAASLDLIKVENLIPAGVPSNIELGKEGHLFERLHGKNPYVQLDKLAEAGLGTRDYETVEVK